MAKKDTMSARELIDIVSGVSKNKPTIVGENKDKYNCEFYLDTGITLLNCLLSGDPYLGMPGDLSVQVTGDASSGKSLFVKLVTRSFYRLFPNAVIDAYETEGAISEKDWAKFIDTNNLMHTRVNHMIDLKNSFKEKMKPIKRGYRWMSIVDSIAMIPDSEQYEKNQKGDSTKVMGKKAQETNVLFSAILDEAHEKHIPLIFVNRKYQNMDVNKYTRREDRETTTGGKGNDFAPSISLDFKKKIIEDTVDYLDDSGNMKQKKMPVGTEIRVWSEKNRLAREHMEIVLYIDHSKGLMKYYGLPNYAFKAGLLKKDKDGRSNVWYIAGTEEPFKTVPDITDEAWEKCLANGLADFLRNEFKQVDLFQKLEVAV